MGAGSLLPLQSHIPQSLCQLICLAPQTHESHRNANLVTLVFQMKTLGFPQKKSRPNLPAKPGSRIHSPAVVAKPGDQLHCITSNLCGLTGKKISTCTDLGAENFTAMPTPRPISINSGISEMPVYKCGHETPPNS